MYCTLQWATHLQIMTCNIKIKCKILYILQWSIFLELEPYVLHSTSETLKLKKHCAFGLTSKMLSIGENYKA